MANLFKKSLCELMLDCRRSDAHRK